MCVQSSLWRRNGREDCVFNSISVVICCRFPLKSSFVACQPGGLVGCHKSTLRSIRIISSSSSLSGFLEYKQIHFMQLIIPPLKWVISVAKSKPLCVILQPSRGAVSRLMESMAADEDFEPNQDSSFSEDELLPQRSNSVSERSSTPGQCSLQTWLAL